MGGTRFLDQNFTLESLNYQTQSNSYSILHIATHSEFGGTAASTFLQAYNGRVSLEEFEEILRNSKEAIDLLTLSSCQTAAGDSHSTFGFAGLAARTKVKSVLASLWFVNDEDTVPLIKDFYTQLRQPGVTKAQALRKAQLNTINTRIPHPGIWSSFVLLGNWE